MRSYFDLYGLKPMSLEEELTAPAPIRETRSNKINIVSDCEDIMKVAGWLWEYARVIPEENDPVHAALVKKLADAISQAKTAIYAAREVGKS